MASQRMKKRVIGTQQFINSVTGELVEMEVVESEVANKDFNFHKLFLKDFIATFELVGNKKTKLCYWIIDNINRENMLTYSYRQIAEKTGISYDTVAKTMKILLNADFLRKHGKVLIVNPDIIFKGTYARRCNILNMYRTAQTGEKKANNQIRINQIRETIAGLTKQLEKLEAEEAGSKKEEPQEEAEA